MFTPLQVLPIMGNGEGEVILEIIPDFETTGAKLQRVSQEMNNNLQENTKLQGDLDGFKKEVDHLRGEVNRMSAENDRFSANNKKLEEENNRFADNNKKLEEENGKFAENNKKLEAQVSIMLVLISFAGRHCHVLCRNSQKKLILAKFPLV